MKNTLRNSMTLMLGVAALAVSSGAWAHGPDGYRGYYGHHRHAPVVVYPQRYYAPRHYYAPPSYYAPPPYYAPPVVHERVIVREVQPVPYYPQPGFTIGVNVPPIVVHIR